MFAATPRNLLLTCIPSRLDSGAMDDFVRVIPEDRALYLIICT